MTLLHDIRYLCVCSILLGCVLTTGCGDPGLPLVEVTGRVTFNGGPPPKPGRLSFSAERGSGIEGLPYRPGSATFGEDGEFVVSMFKDQKGLLPGAYKVQVFCLSELPGHTKTLDQVNMVPPEWAPDDLVIQKGQDPVRLEFDVPRRKR